MDEKSLPKILIDNINYLMSNKDQNTPSMRYLSACIGANNNYMQKVMSGTTFPSADKLEAIAAHFEMLPIVKEVSVYLLGTLPKNK